MYKKFIFAIVCSALLVTSCEKDLLTKNKIDTEIEKDAISYYGGIITLNDFPHDKIFPSEHYNKFKGNIGLDPKTAIVPLIFDKNGVLYTASRFNNEIEQGEKEIQPTYVTDLTTFKNVTALTTANSEYSDLIIINKLIVLQLGLNVAI